MVQYYKLVGYNNDAYKVGKSCNIGSTKDGAKLISTTNIWSGRSNMLAGVGPDMYGGAIVMVRGCLWGL